MFMSQRVFDASISKAGILMYTNGHMKCKLTCNTQLCGVSQAIGLYIVHVCRLELRVKIPRNL